MDDCLKDMKNFYSSRYPKLYLHIKPNNQKAAGLAELLWPHVELLLLNYTLAVCHWLSLRDITRNSPLKIASVGILLTSPLFPHIGPLMRINGEISLGSWSSLFFSHGHSKVHISFFALASRKFRVKYLSHFFLNIFIFLERGKGGRRRGRETSIGRFLYSPEPGIEPTTWACALIGNQTRNLLVSSMMLNQLSHASQGFVPLLRTK